MKLGGVDTLRLDQHKVNQVAEYNDQRDRRVKQALNWVTFLPIPASNKEILRFIIRRTLYWGKDSEVIPTFHFVNGFRDLQGCGVEARTIERARKRLTKCGYISITARKHPVHGGYIAHQYTIHISAIKRDAMSKLKVSRRRRKESESPKKPHKSRADTLSAPCPQSVVTLKKYSSSIISKRTNTCAADDVDDGLDELVAKAKEKTKAAERRNAGKLNKTRSAAALRSAWSQACLVRRPDVAPTPVSFALAGRFRQMTVNMLSTGAALADFVEWAVDDWDAIRAHFHWMTKPKVPVHPDLEWCARHCSRLLIARAEIEAKKEQAATKTREELLEIELRKTQGELWRSQSLIKPFDPERARRRRIERREQEALEALKPKPKPILRPMTAEELGEDLPAWEDLPRDRK